MAIYRPRRSPWPLAIGIGLLMLLIGFGIGYAAFGTRPPDLDAAAAEVQARLSESRGLLEVAAIEYREGAPDGTIVSEAEYGAAEQAVARADAAFAVVAGPMATLAPERVTAISDGFASLNRLIDDLATPDEVDAAVEALTDLLQPPP